MSSFFLFQRAVSSPVPTPARNLLVWTLGDALLFLNELFQIFNIRHDYELINLDRALRNATLDRS